MPDSVIIYRESWEPFTAACGNGQPLGLAVSRAIDRSSIDLHAFDKPFVRIGRSVQNDLVLPDRGVSFRHTYLQLVDGQWVYFDLHATVRSRGGRRSRPAWGWLHPLQELDVGPFRISPRPSGAADSAAPRRDRAMPEPVTEFQLELVNRQQEPMRRIRRAVSLIGSSRHCDLWLNDPSVSSVHASLVLTSRGVWVVDLLGRNGISVNRRRVSWKQLENGSFLEIGGFCFRVWINDAKPLTLDEGARSIARPDPAEPVLHAGAIDGSLTREFVMGVLNHLVESRTEFFDHLRQQSQLIHKLFEQMNELRTAPAVGDLQRIERLDQELADIKQQLQRLTEASESSAQLRDIPSAGAEFDVRPVSDEVAANDGVEETAAAGPMDGLDAAAPNDVRGPVEASDADVGEPAGITAEGRMASPAGPEISVAEAHALLSQRMSQLAQERNSLLHKLLRHFRAP